LASKTVILVTHQLQWVKHFDNILFLEDGQIHNLKDGKIELINPSSSSFAKVLNEYWLKGDNHDHDSYNVTDMDDAIDVTVGPGPSGFDHEFKQSGMASEDRAIGSVSVKTYLKYFQASCGIVVGIILVALLILGEFSLVYTDVWLAKWASVDYMEQRRTFYPVVFGLLALGTLIVSMARAITYFMVTLTATKRIFEQMLTSVMNCSMYFFQVL